MKVRIAGRLAPIGLAMFLSAGLAGCGGGIEEGMPKDIDMTKNYSPPVPVGPIQPGDMKKAQDPNRPMATTPGN